MKYTQLEMDYAIWQAKLEAFKEWFEHWSKTTSDIYKRMLDPTMPT